MVDADLVRYYTTNRFHEIGHLLNGRSVGHHAIKKRYTAVFSIRYGHWSSFLLEKRYSRFPQVLGKPDVMVIKMDNQYFQEAKMHPFYHSFCNPSCSYLHTVLIPDMVCKDQD